MPIGSKIQYEELENLNLDPDNPRLGREFTQQQLKQPAILDLMKDWSLDVLATSFLESGFWPHEAVLVIKQPLYGKERLVVVEGNRRIAALKLLKDAYDGKPASRKWAELAESKRRPASLFTDIPYLLVDSRTDVDAFLGFRHVTGIAEWHPAEKAEFIAHLIEQRHMTYEEVMRKIGSKTTTVRQNYISYRLLLQMEGKEEIDVAKVESRFSVLYLSLRSSGVQKYLDIDIMAGPKAAKHPVPASRLKALAKFALWLFGNEDEDIEPLVTDSRDVDRFGAVLANDEAVSYLERTAKPSLQVAFRLAGGDEQEVIESIEKAADLVEDALGRAHAYKKSLKLQLAVERLGLDVEQLLRTFPAQYTKVKALP